MSTLAPRRQPMVLLVEDNEDDVEIARLGFRQAGLAVELHHVCNGEDCLGFLRREAAQPDLVLLDLNMPRMNGREVLEAINKDAALRHLPVIVLTSSHDAGDILECYRLRCSSYIVKPLEFNDFLKMVKSICHYWLEDVILPAHVLRPDPHPSRLAIGHTHKASG